MSIRQACSARLQRAVGDAFCAIVVAQTDVTLDDAVRSYLFNSQLLARDDGRWLLLAPAECREHPRVSAYLDRLIASGGPIVELMTLDLRQSMRNGGGPACLRLRVPLTDAERAAITPRVFLDDSLADDARSLDSASTIAIDSRRTTLPIRRCSTSRAARSTS